MDSKHCKNDGGDKYNRYGSGIGFDDRDDDDGDIPLLKAAQKYSYGIKEQATHVVKETSNPHVVLMECPKSPSDKVTDPSKTPEKELSRPDAFVLSLEPTQPQKLGDVGVLQKPPLLPATTPLNIKGNPKVGTPQVAMNL